MTRKPENETCRHPKETIVITGASSGFGAAAARAFADRGDRVWGTMRDAEGRNASKKAELEAYSPNLLAAGKPPVRAEVSYGDLGQVCPPR